MSQITRAGFVVWVPFWLAVGIGLWFSLQQEPGPAFYAAVSLVFLLALAGAVLPRFVRFLPDDRAGSDQIILGCFVVCLVTGGALLAGLRSHMVAAPVMTYRYYGPVEGRVVMIDRSARDQVENHAGPCGFAPYRPVAHAGKGADFPDGNSECARAGCAGTGRACHADRASGAAARPSEPGGFDFRRNAWFRKPWGGGAIPARRSCAQARRNGAARWRCTGCVCSCRRPCRTASGGRRGRWLRR
ncbi:hypothetical protein PE067_07265 [Paracoccus sp. DMF-8]|uniref:hypothetical protein n=1 Tax=Paracoccus sp. DMF-8 TaxID=3019445 RepID=UPI0023E7D017|nr:hypothetical protein [Paracoccus sp. DMF-8]MDF3605950.1 hypothetical protein [Paracoccus sp. DMF-8]